jgi:hypothetical protein
VGRGRLQGMHNAIETRLPEQEKKCAGQQFAQRATQATIVHTSSAPFASITRIAVAPGCDKV